MIGRRLKGGWRLALAVLILCAPLTAQARTPVLDKKPRDPVQARFSQASELLYSGQHEQAVQALASLAKDYPHHDLADDALFLAGQTCEDKLGDPARAAELFRRLVELYPDSRSALGASRRLNKLEAGIDASGGGDEALARFTVLMSVTTELGSDESLRRAQAIIDDFPEWKERHRVHAWAGFVLRRLGRLEEARQQFLAAARVQPPGDHSDSGLRSAAAVAVDLGDFDHAEELLARVARTGDSASRRALEDVQRSLERARLRARLYQASFAIMGLVLLVLLASLRLASGSMGRALGNLVRPPTEVIYLIPVLVLLVILATTGHKDIGPAVAIVCSAGLIVTWLSGVGLRADKRRRNGRIVLHAAACSAFVIAACYVALHRTPLIDLIITTVRFGPEA